MKTIDELRLCASGRMGGLSLALPTEEGHTSAYGWEAEHRSGTGILGPTHSYDSSDPIAVKLIGLTAGPDRYRLL